MKNDELIFIPIWILNFNLKPVKCETLQIDMKFGLAFVDLKYQSVDYFYYSSSVLLMLCMLGWKTADDNLTFCLRFLPLKYIGVHVFE